MERLLTLIGRLTAVILTVLLLTACNSIDEDLSDCESNFELNYELRLVTNMTTEMQTQLTTQTDMYVGASLRNYLSNIFTDYAHDVDLSFYDTVDDSIRLDHQTAIMNDNQKTYTLYLPKRQYQHLAVANLQNDSLVTLTGDEKCHTAKLLQINADTITSLNTGIFTARQPLNVLEVDTTFHVKLYMVNCATALVLDTTGIEIRSIRAEAVGFATGFNICDSTFTFRNNNLTVKADNIDMGQNSKKLCLCTVSLPSREPFQQRLVIETEEPFANTYTENGLWQYKVYVTLKNGTTTQSVLNMATPLRAGQLKIIKASLRDDGAVVTNAINVGVSVTLDWKPGGEYNPIL